MRYLAPVLLLVLCGCHPSTPTARTAPITLVLMRHAEKADETADPPLTDRGRKRAATLAVLLGNVAIDALYATPYQRTEATLLPLARAHGLAITPMDTDPAAFAATLRRRHAGDIVVACGHSNTIPPLLTALGVTPPEKVLSGYDDLFMVRVDPAGSDLHHLHYRPFTEETP